MTRKSKVRWAGGAAAVMVMLTIGLYAYGRLRRGPDTVLPTFTEPAAGPRAPVSERFGFHVGRTTLAEANSRLGELGVACENTSIRAVMDRVREAKKKEQEDKKAKGEDPDTVTGASIIHHKTKREKNPQVRLSCEKVAAKTLGEDWAGDATGRLLLVFDSPDLPLRHVSFSRDHIEDLAALSDYDAVSGRFVALFGGAPKEAAAKPAKSGTSEAGPGVLTRFEKRSRTWEFSDLSASVVLINYSTLGPSVTETVEVPWPVRPDAPTRPSAPEPQAAK